MFRQSDDRLEGYWWVPSRPQKQVAGTLILAAAPCKGELNLLGDLMGSPPREDEHEIVLGRTHTNLLITLCDCQVRSYSYWVDSNDSAEIVSPLTVLLRGHFESKEDLSFEGVAIEFDSLCDWANLFEFLPPSDNKARDLVEVGYRRANDTIVLLPFGTLIIVVAMQNSGSHYSGPNRGSYRGPLTMTPQALVCFYPIAPVTLSESINLVINPLRALLSFGVGTPCHVVSLSVKVTSRPELSAENLHEWIPVLYDQRLPHLGNEARLVNKWFFWPPQCHLSLEEIVSAWFRLWDNCEMPLGMFFTPDYDDGMSEQTRFLLTVQSLEGYHRRTHVAGGSMMVDKKRGLTLAGRLKDLLLRETSVSGGLSEPAKFVEIVVRTRNYLIHQEPGFGSGTVNDRLLRTVTEILRFFMRSALLHGIGFPEEDIRRVFDNRHDLQRHLKDWAVAAACPRLRRDG